MLLGLRYLSSIWSIASLAFVAASCNALS
ncbi:variable surface lipoprotein [Lactobacillus sp. W8173]